MALDHSCTLDRNLLVRKTSPEATALLEIEAVREALGFICPGGIGNSCHRVCQGAARMAPF